MSPEEGRAVWVTRDRAEAAEARVKVLEAEVKRLKAELASLSAPSLGLASAASAEERR